MWPGRATGPLAALLRGRSQGRFLTFAEQRVRISENPRRYRIADIYVAALPYAPEPVLTRPPHLMIEIVSPEDPFADLLAKVAEYLKTGVPHLWIPNPCKRTLHAADPDGIRLCQDLITETELVGRVDFGELFAKLDALEG
jgi:Uma2 family endonuclease